LAPDSIVTVNDRIIGKRTGEERQIDVSVRRMIGQFELLIVIDCRNFRELPGGTSGNFRELPGRRGMVRSDS
ncbi:MAG: hypothetical protein WBW33_33345, partial [Bryobacteraceae bacterium]